METYPVLLNAQQIAGLAARIIEYEEAKQPAQQFPDWTINDAKKLERMASLIRAAHHRTREQTIEAEQKGREMA